MIAVGLLAVFYAALRTEIPCLSPVPAARWQDGIIRADGRVRDILMKDGKTRLTIEIARREKIFAYMDEADEDAYRIGYKVAVSGKFEAFRNAGNPGEFDSKNYYDARGVTGRVYVRGAEVTEESPDVLRNALYRTRSAWGRIIDQIYPEREAGIARAILLGDRASLDADWKNLYAQVGISHILAVSGLHISFLGRALRRGLQGVGASRLLSGALSAALVFFYALMTGAQPSAIRALIFFLLSTGADIRGRGYDLCSAFCFAAAILLFYNPLLARDAGFILSFAAAGSFGVSSLIPTKSKAAGLLVPALVLQLVTFPIVLRIFFQYPLYSSLVNFLVIPGMSIVLGFGFLSVGGYFLYAPLGAALAVPGSLTLRLYTFLCAKTAAFPYNGLILGRPEIARILLYYVCLFAALYLMITGNKGKARKVTKSARRLAPVLFVTAAFLALLAKTGRGFRLMTLDVGQGDAIYMETPSGHHYLVDGGSSDIKEIAKWRLTPFLKSRGASELDYVFLTHFDEDHINGVRELLKNTEMDRIRIRNLVLTTSETSDPSAGELIAEAKAAGANILVIGRGDQIADGDCVLECLYPGAEAGAAGADKNDQSLVLLIRYRGFKAILTGDLEEKGEAELIRYARGLEENGADLDCSVLKVGHHGSSSSTSKAFLDFFKPESALISCGIDNRYGHPHKETLTRLAEAGINCYNTAQTGAAMVWTDGRRLVIRTFLKGRP